MTLYLGRSLKEITAILEDGEKKEDTSAEGTANAKALYQGAGLRNKTSTTKTLSFCPSSLLYFSSRYFFAL